MRLLENLWDWHMSLQLLQKLGASLDGGIILKLLLSFHSLYVFLSCHCITLKNRSPFLPFLSPQPTTVATTESLISPKFPGSRPSSHCSPEGEKKGERQDWDLADGRQNWKRCLPHNIFHWHFILVSISNIHCVQCI